MRGKTWNQLSPSYRARLTKHGITEATFAEAKRNGQLRAARGHAATPERPERAQRNPERYKQYLADRANIIRRIESRKERLYGDVVGYRRINSIRNIHERPTNGKRPTVKNMRAVLKMTDAQLDEVLSRAGYLASHDLDGPELEFDFMFYH